MGTGEARISRLIGPLSSEAVFLSHADHVLACCFLRHSLTHDLKEAAVGFARG